MDIPQFLTEHRFFSGLDPEYTALFAKSASVREFAPGKSLVHHGAQARSFFVVCEGRVRREIPSLVGPPLVMHSIGPGDVLGWGWLIPPRQWSFVARAEEPTRVIEFDGQSILERCESDPRFGYEVLKRFSRLMSERLTHTRMQMIKEWNPAGFG